MIPVLGESTISNSISEHNFYLNKGNTRIFSQNIISMAKTILEPYRVAREVLRSGDDGHLPHTSLYYSRVYMRLLGLWPQKRRVEQPLYYGYNVLLMTLFSFFVVTIICDLYEASGDFVLLGEDLVVALGLYLILFKMLLCRSRIAQIDSIVNEFDTLHFKYAHELMSRSQSNRRIRQWQRDFFIGEIGLFTGFFILSFLLFSAMSLQPLFSLQTLPFRSKYPFGLDDPDEHPIVFAFIYAFQCTCVLYMLVSIVVMDSLGGNCFNQTTLNLRILCENIRQIYGGSSEEIVYHELRVTVEFHQKIICLNERLNEVFYWNYVSQIGASTFMICLTAFEALLAQDQPMVAMKFQLYMFSAFTQLFYWCSMGNRTYYESMEVATAAFEVHTWYNHSPRLQRNLMFMIQRAQKPLEFRPKPFFGFTFASFTSILSTSYSYFAMLRTMSD